MGAFLSKIRALDGRNSSFYAFVVFFDLVHVQNVVNPFAKQLNQRSKYAQNHKRQAKGTKNWAFDRKFLTYARLDGRARLQTGDLVTLLLHLCWHFSMCSGLADLTEPWRAPQEAGELGDIQISRTASFNLTN